ncbi:PilT domain-containing protein [Rhizobium sp. Kim5]|uniref:type II toxin-antitoxin system VapC family toxin n=1 Tax=Rhizobium sp. Kim5 TaxID=2020311 RepID=UPI000A2A264D|nr:PIN domain-containing protein [Rhizobium sp. Kim5]ARQ56861.1 PilT domain-containing protein [Rhizobium sp. Kim5]
MTTFLDTNIVIALLDNKHLHHAWSVAELEKIDRRPAIVSDIVYCEVSVGMPDQASLDAAIARLGLERIPAKDEALFRAGEAFKRYRTVNKGTKTGVLPDFLIGAIAEIEETPLMTTNEKDFTGYFSKLELISPPKTVTVAAAFTAPGFGVSGSGET